VSASNDLASFPLRVLLSHVDDETLADEVARRKACLARSLRRARAREVARIRVAVARLYGLTPAEISGQSRHRGVAIPRQIAMALAYEAGLSLPQIGKAFARHHTTVLHARRYVARMEREDLQTAMSLALLRAELKDGIA